MKKIYVLLIVALFGFGIANAQYHEISKAGWTVVADSYESTYDNNPPTYAIDGDPNTIWHTPWDGTGFPQPHWIVVDFGKEIDIDGFSYLPRPGAGNGTIKTWGFYMAAADSVWMDNDSLHGEFSDPWDTKHDVFLPNAYHVRYMKLLSWEERWNQGFTSCAEFGALKYGADFTADTTHVRRGESIQFHNISKNGYTAISWTFEGGAPGTSTEEEPLIEYDTVGTFDVQLVAVYNGTGDTVVINDLITVDIPTAFSAENTHIFRGEAVQFHNESLNATSLEWIFEGGTPETSSEENPLIEYNQAGVYDVTLIASYSDGQKDTVVKSDYIAVDIPYVDRSGWVKLYTDSHQGADDGEHVYDGDPNTIWHTQWSPTNDPYPHTLVIDMGAKVQVEGFVYTPRSDGGNGTVKDYEFYVLTDEAMWDDPGTWGSPVASGTWDAPWDQDKRVFLSTPVLGRYLIFYALSERNDNAWASCAEMNVMGTLFGSTFTADRTEIYETQMVEFNGGPDGKAAYHWIFPGGDPATADVQDTIVKYFASGTYDATLITTSYNGDKDTLTRSDYITVKPRPANKPLEKDGWSVIAWDSQEEPNERWASNVIDGDLNTIWHTAWSERQDPYPHWLIIDMGKNEDVAGFVYYPRPGGGNGTVDSCAWLVSLDGEIWDTVAKGDRSDGWADPWYFDMDETVTARFVKFLALSEKGYPEDPSRVWASCGEIDVTTPITGTYFQAEPLRIESGESVYYLDLSAGDPSAWDWSFDKGVPATSNEQSPKVTYNLTYEELGKPLGASLTVNGETYTRKDYVTVDYYEPSSNGGVYVDTVQVGDVFQHISNTYGKYNSYVDEVITVVKGSRYVMKLGYFLPWNNYEVGIGAYVDWNMNYHFDKDTEGVYYEYTGKQPYGSNSTLFYLDVPADAHTGLTRMRVYAGVWSGDNPYNFGGYGGAKDYTLKIVDAPTEAPVAQFDADTTEICEGGTIHFEYVCDDDAKLATAWQWTFTGATDTASTIANPTVTYETPGTYAVKLRVENDNGADSVTVAAYVTVYGGTAIDAGPDDKVCPGSEVVLDITEVDSVVWNNGVVDEEPFYPTDSLVYVATGYNEHNCPSTDTVIIAVWDPVDTTVVKYGEDTLVAQASPDDYVFQWVNADDGTPIEGETDSIFVAGHGGNYAVVVTQVSGGQCSDTSGVWAISITGIEDNFGGKINIYPNPNDGHFTVNIGREHATISVYNTIGSLIYRKENANSVEHLSLDTEGIYFVKIELNGVTETRRVVVH
jgi:PKD repeat protein